MVVMILQKLQLWHKVTGLGNGNTVIMEQEMRNSLFGRISSYSRGDPHFQLFSNREKTAVERPVMNGIEAKAVPRISPILHIN